MTHETLRYLRTELKWTHLELARRLDVPLETYRCWEDGRRAIPSEVIERLSVITGEQHRESPTSLGALADLLGINVRTLRAAARDGRLAVTYGTRCSLGRPVPMATKTAGWAFVHLHYRKTSRCVARPPRPRPQAEVPDNYDLHLVGLRTRRRWTQEQLARAIGVAGKAVIYQWESRRRKPSAALWARIQALPSADDAKHRDRNSESSVPRWCEKPVEIAGSTDHRVDLTSHDSFRSKTKCFPNRALSARKFGDDDAARVKRGSLCPSESTQLEAAAHVYESFILLATVKRRAPIVAISAHEIHQLADTMGCRTQSELGELLGITQSRTWSITTASATTRVLRMS
jgi:transcriptional regulator with XRE-family HTH domain